jgi:ETFB lysine methyltransferase
MQRVDPPQGLASRFAMARTHVQIASRDYELLRPRDIDSLISEEEFALDERIPYWADCWPSARVLADRIARETGRGRSLLELGCGIGLVSLVAAQVGFQVLATDYYADALEFTAANAQRNGVEVDTRLVDWRRLPNDLGTFDLVAASDVLYEAPQAALVATILAAAIAPGGLGLVSDPGRRTAPALVERCLEMGLEARCAQQVPTRDGDIDLTVSIFEVRRATS